MVGLSLSLGIDGAEAAANRLLAPVTDMGATGSIETAVTAPAPDMALGHAWHRRMPHLRAPVVFADGIVCAVHGDIYDDNCLFAEPEEMFAELFRTKHLYKAAWLNGSFTAILLDTERRRAALVTDRLASKSLFVWQHGKSLMAASRLGPLAAEPSVPKRLSRQGMAELLAYQRTVAGHTQYADIEAMKAAQVWSWEDGTLTCETARRLAWTKPDFTKKEAAEGLAAALVRAAGKRLSDPVRHGLLMSGGLDSRIVLAAARQAGRKLSCATVGAWEGTEVLLARRASESGGAPFKLYDTDADILAGAMAPSTLASDGLFAAPVNLFGSLAAMTEEHDAMLSGHGLDYTLRGYYLPCKTLRIAGSVTRMPKLRKIADGTPETVADSLRVGISPETAKTILAPDFAEEFDKRRVDAMRDALAEADIEDPYNAWDAFVLHALGRHYAYSDFVAIEEIIDHRALTFDPMVFDLYLSMPPSWRAEGDIAHRTMMQLGPDMMALPDANTGFSARYGFNRQIALVLGRAVLRRAGLLKRPTTPAPGLTHGSWLDTAQLFRHDPHWRGLAESLPEDETLLDTGLFRREGLADAVTQHMDGKANHKKLFMQLLTLSAWFSAYPADRATA